MEHKQRIWLKACVLAGFYTFVSAYFGSWAVRDYDAHKRWDCFYDFVLLWVCVYGPLIMVFNRLMELESYCDNRDH